MPFQFVVAEAEDDLPVAKRERKSNYTDEDTAFGRAALESIAKLGRHSSYADARAAHAVLTDRQPYAEKVAASNAASRTVALLRFIVGSEWREATFHQVVAKRKDGGYGWAVYIGPYEAPKPRQRKPKDAAPAATPAATPARSARS